MPNPFALMPTAVSHARPNIVYAQVSTTQPAPSTFTDPLYVVLPQWQTDTFFTVTDWPQLHGSALPAHGADCVVVTDTTRTLRCVWWAGPYQLAAKTANTTGLTSAQINALFGVAPPNGTLLADTTNHLLLVRAGGQWYKSAALTLIP